MNRESKIIELDGAPPPTAADPRLHALWKFLAEKRRGKRFTARSDFDPMDIPKLLPHLSLVAVRPEQPRFVYTVFGTGLVELLKSELTGKSVGTGVKDSELASVLSRYERVADRGIAIYHVAYLQEAVNDFTTIQRLMMPLSDDDKHVDRILSIVVPSADLEFTNA